MRAGDTKHRAVAVAARCGAAGTGTPQIGVRFELLDEPGRFMTWYGALSDAAFSITMKDLIAAGFDGDDVEDVSWVEHAPEVTLVVGDETYKGQTTRKIKFINAGGIGMKADAPAGFGQRLRGKVLAFRQAEGLPVAQRKAVPRRAASGGGFADRPQEAIDREAGEQGDGGGGPDDIPF